MGELAAMVAAVEAHLRHVRHFGARAQFADLLEPDNLGPESVRFFDVAHVDHDVIDADRGDAVRLSHLALRANCGLRRAQIRLRPNSWQWPVSAHPRLRETFRRRRLTVPL